jgi:hypothetical protein
MKNKFLILTASIAFAVTVITAVVNVHIAGKSESRAVVKLGRNESLTSEKPCGYTVGYTMTSVRRPTGSYIFINGKKTEVYRDVYCCMETTVPGNACDFDQENDLCSSSSN